MKIYIFGTGHHYKRIINHVNPENIIALIDNDVDKQNRIVNGKKVISPKDANFLLCDFVVIAVYLYEDILQQLLELGVPEKKILHYKNIGDKTFLRMEIEFEGKRRTYKKINENVKAIFLCINEFSRTGVPVAAMNTALLLKKMGYDVVIGALSDGNLIWELKEKGLAYIRDLEFFSEEQWIDLVKSFDLIILGTIVMSRFGNVVADHGIPIIWWIHESGVKFFIENKLPVNVHNVYFYAVGTRVINLFSKFYPHEKIEKLLYYLPDSQRKRKTVVNKKVVFAIIGSFILCKAQDVFVTAVERLSESIRLNAEFIMVGDYVASDYSIEWEQKAREIPQLTLLGELSQQEINELYGKIDVLVCPSRGDSMPIVVTQAMGNGIPCIVSTEVGQVEYINDKENGILIKADDADALADSMEYCINNRDRLPEMGRLSEKIFETYFSETIMRRKLAEMLKTYL